jgi:sterol desaturase/sphingolipid hydroxylase (fatty acid hydroxylase superfamily)
MLQFIGQHFYLFLVDLVRLCLWLTILVVIFVPLERLFAAHPQKILRQEIGADLGYYFLSSLLPALLLSAPLGVLAWAVYRTVPGSLHAATAALPLWARALAGLVAGEIGYYGYHRLSHQVPFLWRFHSIHHSATQIDFLVNTRAHPVDMVLSKFSGLVPIYVLGLGGPLGAAGSTVPMVAALTGTVWGFFIHANLRWRLGPLEWLMSTPAFHHWHHTLAGPTNRNYASMLPWLDRIFGTHYLPREGWPAAYGIEAKLPCSLAGQLAYPLYARPAAPGPQKAAKQPPRLDVDAATTQRKSPRSQSPPRGKNAARTAASSVKPEPRKDKLRNVQQRETRDEQENQLAEANRRRRPLRRRAGHQRRG